MPRVKINNQEVDVPQGFTVLQACEQVGIEIPRFCYHDRLSIAGNCRMCLVEVKPGPPKPQASCALPIADNMEIFTDSDMVKKARAGVMEFLLINHPLDCPICDQGGECDLQDQAMGYGKVGSRYVEHKRAVPDKYMGPLINTVMTRCIHCTRCVRFAEEVAGVSAIGLMGRGEQAEISTLEQAVRSELSGNVIDLCPVGALTSKPGKFSARSWEMQKTPAIDLSDGMGSNITLWSRDNAVMRVQPRLQEYINEEWITDRARFLHDGLHYQRLDRPYVKTNGRLQPASWGQALAVVAKQLQKLSGNQVAVVAGQETSIGTMVAVQRLATALYGADQQPHYECRLFDEKLPAGNPSQWLMNGGYDGVADSDLILLVGTNPRAEAAVWNGRIRTSYNRRQLRGQQTTIGYVGAPLPADNDLTYPYDYLGDQAALLRSLLDGDAATPMIKTWLEKLAQAKTPMLVLGTAAVGRADGADILALANQLAVKYNMQFHYLSPAANMVGGMAVGFHPAAPEKNSTRQLAQNLTKGNIKLLWLLSADDGLLFANDAAFEKPFVIYQGSHGDRGAAVADVILPSPSPWGEEDGLYINGAGWLQETLQAIAPVGTSSINDDSNMAAGARANWLIIRSLSALLSEPYQAQNKNGATTNMGKVDFNNSEELRALVLADLASKGFLLDQRATFAFQPFQQAAGALRPQGLDHVITNFYHTSAIARCSPTMAECTRVFIEKMEKIESRNTQAA